MMDNELRKNALMAAAVEHAIRLGRERSSAVAWAYMQAYKVPKETIARVLAYPKARRR